MKSARLGILISKLFISIASDVTCKASPDSSLIFQQVSHAVVAGDAPQTLEFETVPDICATPLGRRRPSHHAPRATPACACSVPVASTGTLLKTPRWQRSPSMASARGVAREVATATVRITLSYQPLKTASQHNHTIRANNSWRMSSRHSNSSGSSC